MSRTLLPLVALPLALAASTAFAAAPTPPTVPATLNPPAGQTLYLETLAEGVQIYECGQKPDGTFEWAFKFPDATLATREGKPLGKHYAGPTWEAADGSTVVAAVQAKDPGPDPRAIPWLLLTAKSNTGSGLFANAKSIQRVYTAGGPAPTETCNADKLKQMARVPYTATYYFYR